MKLSTGKDVYANCAMRPMVYCVCTRGWEHWKDCVESWHDTATGRYGTFVCMGQDVVPAMQTCYEETTEPILAFIHDDLVIYEKGWDQRVLAQFDDLGVGVTGLGGSLGHGHPSLYQTPYHLPNLARQTFLSNMRSWKTHGYQFTGERDVAVLDGCALFVRRELLDKLGGWTKASPYGYWLYSEWLCCSARRLGYRIRLAGIDFEHLGGKSSGYINTVPSYDEAHKFLFDHNSDVLPYRVPE
jgi:hypothetical protein